MLNNIIKNYNNNEALLTNDVCVCVNKKSTSYFDYYKYLKIYVLHIAGGMLF